ncbi:MULTISPECIES: ABC transporter ATP-binding protein [Paraclostridium]|jgi:ATP-binding cassette subfamily B protein|uniref:ABC transporter family protein n=1 Tax=Paraclostridium bifermentans ATCC 638 = DSM 14991 TaxID=1233171 RepID=T4VMS0_PARBF|nr:MULTISPECIES: ABC transporter ATP-binding protein [Paraclostridium]KGJ50691.1 thiamine ABC transporter permease [Clostridium sp. NCR]MCU9809029.1 ABC transporter ATP-binding protein/permease [Paraclostridium sp. AKS46]EQK42066.1 ABC transporter family protein [[Clostridium] bifermentans ATCC 638] [Paraclostridium bifermentans ATCC 638 = DSM 14991]EQK47348.1 ABC transporter family protein [[Clostridium] bifermentans ATCC 19299] [Paraclostridium bifermentans ATCC 19299]MCE9674475.1 ABC transp
MLKEFIKYYKPYKKLFILDLIAAFAVALCDLVYPMITRNIMNEVVPNKDSRMLIVFAVTLLLIFIVKAGLNYFMQYWGHVVGVRMQADMRSYVFTHLQKLPNSYFNDNKSGVIMSRIINDLMEVSELAHHGPEDLFVSLVMLIGSFLILLGINVPLTLIIFAILPFIILYAVTQRKRMSKAFMDTRVKTGDVNATLENSIAGMRVTKSFCTEKEELEKFNESNDIFRHAREGAYKVMAEYFSGMFLFIDILNLVVLIVAGYFTYMNYINLGDFAAYLLYVNLFIQPIRKLINFTEQYQNGMTGFERFSEIINEETEKEAKNPIELKDVKGNIEIENVSFTYEDDNEVFKNLSLSVEAGKTVALVGPSGGGKTTLCNLIPRFFDFEEGDIKIDGISVKDVSLNSLRTNIGVVAQDVFLFTGTIKENIIIGKSGATDKEVIDACKKARIHDFIMTLPNGYDTYVGERGIKLSGGQKQRISIARIFLKNPPIMILDEATSALDNVTEQEIQKSLEELGKDRTNLVVAHRLSTIQSADEIIVLTQNGIEERGTHKELIEKGGVYSKLHRK